MKSLDGFVKSSKCTEASAKRIKDQVSQMTVQDLWPIRMVGCEGFWNLLGYSEPGYTLPNQNNSAWTSIISLKHASRS